MSSNSLLTRVIERYRQEELDFAIPNQDWRDKLIDKHIIESFTTGHISIFTCDNVEQG